ncbi:hypothetical protein [Acinetobacter sp. CAAS 2-6]|uniref:hypothetical protein n=1 Tax=Acinetobacter sp. CAAS 2-6 TaxID=3016358 RepID=UPI002DD6297E|nr:hypothetical protein [Acinetobacter sp. CAAS 2-6]
MNLPLTHQPDYFLFAQLLMKHIQQYAQQQPHESQAIFMLGEIYQLFQQDLASTTINLDGIMNIADEYQVETLNGDQKIIQHYQIDVEHNQLLITFPPLVLQSLAEGKTLLAPDPTIQQ